MKKEKVNEKNMAGKTAKVKLTERETAAIRWAGNSAYYEISSYFYDESNEELIPQYMNVIAILRREDDKHALYFVSMLLRQAYCFELLKLVTDLCNAEDESMGLFISTLLTTAYFDLVDDEDEDEEDDDDYEDEYDDEWEDEMEEEFACIKVSVDKGKAPCFEEVFKRILNAIGITPEEIKEKEREQSE